MLHPRTCLLAALLFLVSACTKPGPDNSTPPPPEPKRNLSESLGFQSGEDVFAGNPPPGGAATATEAGIVRTLTSRDGRKMDALLLSRTATAVKIRRTSDKAEFVIPYDKLSDADCAFIKKSALPVQP
jgi:hypothetical protein